jgi:hypothetical protein
MAPDGFSGSGSTSIARVVSAAAVAAEKAAEMRTVEEVAAAKADEVAVAKAVVDATAMKIADQGLHR